MFAQHLNSGSVCMRNHGLFVSAEWFTHEPEAIDFIWATATRLGSAAQGFENR
jgi:hypothetical protein